MFSIGDKIVYPVHGAGVVEGIEEKEVLGEKKSYYILRLWGDEMRIMIPQDQAYHAGLRKVGDEELLERALLILQEDVDDVALNWNKRLRQNMDKIKSGNICQVAEVVRNLMVRDLRKGLANGEKKLLDSAKQILVSEIAVSQNLEEEQAYDLVDSCFHLDC